jgi:hypothetical protein
MDGVLVRQTGRERFDLMPWMPDGKALWAFIAPLKPTLLSMRPNAVLEIGTLEKKEWARRELGPDVPVIVVPDRTGKSPHATPGAILIDDDVHRHAPAWIAKGGVYVHHVSAAETIKRLTVMLAMT